MAVTVGTVSAVATGTEKVAKEVGKATLEVAKEAKTVAGVDEALGREGLLALRVLLAGLGGGVLLGARVGGEREGEHHEVEAQAGHAASRPERASDVNRATAMGHDAAGSTVMASRPL